MKISDAPSTEAAANVKPVVTPAQKETEGTQPPASVQDEVSVGRVALAASNSLETPAAKILELRQKYVDGTYSVEAKDLSAKIVDEHLQE